MKLTLTGISQPWKIQAIHVLCQEFGLHTAVAKAVVDTLAATGRIEVPPTGVHVDRLSERLRPFGVTVQGPEPCSEPIEWPVVTTDSITVAEFNALVQGHVPELLQQVRAEQEDVARADGVQLRDEEDDPTIVYTSLVFFVLPDFIKGATHPIDPNALKRLNGFLMAFEARQPGVASGNLMPMWLRKYLEEVPGSLRYFDAVLLEQEADLF